MLHRMCGASWRLCGGTHDRAAYLQVEHLLDENNMRLRGTSSDVSDAVILQHPGYVLYPTADQLDGQDVNCAAMLVPCHLVPGSDDDSQAS